MKFPLGDFQRYFVNLFPAGSLCIGEKTNKGRFFFYVISERIQHKGFQGGLNDHFISPDPETAY